MQCCNTISQIIGQVDPQSNVSDTVELSSKPALPTTSNSQWPFRRKHTIVAAKTIPKNINKRNMKGETSLHTACVKGDTEYVKLLIDAGANPNTKDNAGWTPLQEAMANGYYDICELILKAGAAPDTPGLKNKTALHEAVLNNDCDSVKLLMSYHANPNVFDEFGKRPLDYCWSNEVRDILQEGEAPEESFDKLQNLNRTLDPSISLLNDQFVVYPSNLNSDSRKLLHQLASKHNVKIVSNLSPSVTHIIVDVNEHGITILTYDVLFGILSGKWIVDSQFIRPSLDIEDLNAMDMALFEDIGAPNIGSFKRARENSNKQKPRLFNGCYFYLALNPMDTYTIGDLKLTKQELKSLIIAGEGRVLQREPKPENINATTKCIPFHVAADKLHPLYNCSHYIIYVPIQEPRFKYNMPEMKTLPLTWLIECIEKFKLIDPAELGLS
ncbi:BRCA1-associated RING domain protein 1 isoform X2 [Cephus cinctus]|nr:BRCA1-associated RING domain protein 1 isoform X2 [Cephus cinctus]XP_024935720.1 BRCA1-associated RING domain protein 1 isoform X2 [Cephus cinctus]